MGFRVLVAIVKRARSLLLIVSIFLIAAGALVVSMVSSRVEGASGTVDRVAVNRVAVETDVTSGRTSEIFRPGAWPFTPAPERPLQDILFSRMRPGHIQIDLGHEIFRPSGSRAEAFARLGQVKPFLRRVLDNGGEVTVSISKIPPWLSSDPLEAEAAAESPPADGSEWANFMEAVVRRVATVGQVRWRIGWEPDTHAWRGTELEFFEFYRASVTGILRADSSLAIGGPGVSDFGPHWKGGREPMLKSFLSYAARTPLPEFGLDRLPVDFIALHQFGTSPWVTWHMVKSVVGNWAVAAGYPRDTPIFIGEWSDTPEPFSSNRERSFISSYIVANLLAMDAAGIDAHSYTSLTEQQTREDTQFGGGFGLFTSGLVARPAALAFMALDGLGPQRVSLETVGKSLFAIAGRSDKHITLVVSNYAPADRLILSDFVDRMRLEGLVNTEIADRLQNERGIERALRDGVSGTDSFAEAAARARSGTLALESGLQIANHGPIDVQIMLEGLSWLGPFDAELYRIDSQHGNPAAASRRIDAEIRSAIESISLDDIRRELLAAGYLRTDLELFAAMLKSPDRRRYVGDLRVQDQTTLMEMIMAVKNMQSAAAAPLAQRYLEQPETGLAPSERQTSASTDRIEFSTWMEPNSVLLIVLQAR